MCDNLNGHKTKLHLSIKGADEKKTHTKKEQRQKRSQIKSRNIEAESEAKIGGSKESNE